MIFNLIIFFLVFVSGIDSANMQLDIQAEQFSAMQIAIFADKKNDLVNDIIKKIAYTNQLLPKYFNNKVSKSSIEKLAQDDFTLLLTLDFKQNTVEWVLIDTLSSEVLISKELSIDQNTPNKILNSIWPILFDEQICFGSKIAAVRKIDNKKNQIVLIDPFTKAKTTVSSKKSNCYAPRFHSNRDIIYYSEHTPTNVRLVGYEPESKKHFFVCNNDGLNMTPSIFDNNVIMVLAPHGTSGIYKVKSKRNKRLFKRITPEDTQVISPTFISKNQILCNRFVNNRPFISIYNDATNSFENLISDSALAPSYCSIKDRVYFIKRVNGYLQLFYVDMKNKKQVQLSYDQTNKDHPWASPCGKYLVFTEISPKYSRITMLDLVSGELVYLTPKNQDWHSPVWSGF